MSTWQIIGLALSETALIGGVSGVAWYFGLFQRTPDFRSMSDEVLDHACHEYFGKGIDEIGANDDPATGMWRD